MNRVFSYILLAISAFMSYIIPASAHPLDISSTVLSLGWANTIAGTTYFHTYEVGVMLSRLWYDVSDVGLFNSYHEDIIQYFHQNFAAYSDDMRCQVSDIRIPKKEAYEMLSRGVEVRYMITCPTKPKNISIHLDFFLDFPLQTNRISIVGVDGKELLFKVGTPQAPIIHYQMGSKINPIDTDGDGLSDEEELVYKTDPLNPDTDGDFYYDGEEVNFWWSPINPDPSPGQKRRTAYPDTINLRPDSTVAQDVQDRSLASIWIWGSIFENLLKKIGMTISREEVTAFPIIFAITVFLGFLHALGPGHAKGLLSGIMVHKDASFFSGMKFILIFSLTHILDIFFLFLIIHFLFQFVDAGILLTGVQKTSAIILLWLWFYLMYRAFRGRLDEPEETWGYSTWRITLLAIIAWLAPCSFWWSLFFMLMSLGKTDWIPPLIFAIALGIFICLFSILVVLYYTKKTSYSKFHSLSRYSVRFSAILIFVIWMYLTTSNFGL